MFNFTYSDSYTVLLKQFLAIQESGMGEEKKKKGGEGRRRSGHEMLKTKQNPVCYVALLRRVENKLKGWGSCMVSRGGEKVPACQPVAQNT